MRDEFCSPKSAFRTPLSPVPLGSVLVKENSMLRSLALVGTVCLFLACQGEWFGPPDSPDSPDSPTDHVAGLCDGQWVWQEPGEDGFYEDRFVLTIQEDQLLLLTPVGRNAQSLRIGRSLQEVDHGRMMLTFATPEDEPGYYTLLNFQFEDVAGCSDEGLLHGLMTEEDINPQSDDYPQLIPEYAGRLVRIGEVQN